MAVGSYVITNYEAKRFNTEGTENKTDRKMSLSGFIFNFPLTKVSNKETH